MSVSLSLSLEQFHCFWYSRYFCNTRKTCTSRYFWTCRTISIRCMLHILFWIPAPAGPKIYISVVPDLVGHIKELPNQHSTQAWCARGQLVQCYREVSWHRKSIRRPPLTMFRYRVLHLPGGCLTTGSSAGWVQVSTGSGSVSGVTRSVMFRSRGH